MLNNLKDKILSAAAKLWDVPRSEIQLEWKPEAYFAGVYTQVNPLDADKGHLNWRVSVYPLPSIDPERDVVYHRQLLLGLLDVVEGALRRHETSRSIVDRVSK